MNDEWKVSYKSLISYECHIFNRWGTQMIPASTNPAEGWDGKYRGKYVPAGGVFLCNQGSAEPTAWNMNGPEISISSSTSRKRLGDGPAE